MESAAVRTVACSGHGFIFQLMFPGHFDVIDADFCLRSLDTVCVIRACAKQLVSLFSSDCFLTALIATSLHLST